MSEMISWTRPMLERLKKAHTQALAAGKTKDDTFMFDNHEFVIIYAAYLIEYLETKL